jgi:hypothetical protein
MIRGILLHLLVLLSSSSQQVNGFAAWLKCFIDLTDTDEVIMNNHIVPNDMARYSGVDIEVKLAQDDNWLDSLEYPGDRTTTVTARLKVPSQLADMDMQYVMETSSGASFVRPKMCEGRRAHAVHYGESVVLEISGTTPSVELLAGYATGHEAVTLTKKLVLQRKEVQEL